MEEQCPLNIGFRILGKAWTAPIIDALYKEPMRYSQLAKSIDGLHNKVLQDRLKLMEENNIICRKAGDKGSVVYYELTDWGRSAHKVNQEVRSWMTECPKDILNKKVR